jgi:hypothetical protein
MKIPARKINKAINPINLSPILDAMECSYDLNVSKPN